MNEEKRRLRSVLIDKQFGGRFHEGQAFWLYPALDSGITVDEIISALNTVHANTIEKRNNDFDSFCKKLFKGSFRVISVILQVGPCYKL